MAAWYNRGRFNVFGQNTDVEAASRLKAMLTVATHTFNPDHNQLSEVSTDRASGSTDVVLTGVALSEDDTNDRVDCEANQVVFNAVPAGAAVGEVIVYDDVLAADELFVYIDFSGGDITPNGSDITVQFSGSSPGDLARIA